MDVFNTVVFYEGMFDAAGFSSQLVNVPASGLGPEPIVFQGLQYDPVTTEYRWTNVVSILVEDP